MREHHYHRYILTELVFYEKNNDKMLGNQGRKGMTTRSKLTKADELIQDSVQRTAVEPVRQTLHCGYWRLQKLRGVTWPPWASVSSSIKWGEKLCLNLSLQTVLITIFFFLLYGFKGFFSFKSSTMILNPLCHLFSQFLGLLLFHRTEVS